MTDLEILNENDLSKKVYMVFEKYKPLIMKKASLYERCSSGRIQKEDFISDVYEFILFPTHLPSCSIPKYWTSCPLLTRHSPSLKIYVSDPPLGYRNLLIIRIFMFRVLCI